MAEFRPDWRLTLQEQVAVALSLSMTRHVPTWGGATDAQMDAVAADVVAVLAGTAEGIAAMRDALRSARDAEPPGDVRSTFNAACDRMDVLASVLEQQQK